MKQVIQSASSGELSLRDVPDPKVRAGHVLVRTRTSLISPGTERLVVAFAKKSLAAKARARPDLVKKVMAKARRDGLKATWDAVRARLDEPLPLGYSAAGEVVAVGAGLEGAFPRRPTGRRGRRRSRQSRRTQRGAAQSRRPGARRRHRRGGLLRHPRRHLHARDAQLGDWPGRRGGGAGGRTGRPVGGPPPRPFRGSRGGPRLRPGAPRPGQAPRRRARLGLGRDRHRRGGRRRDRG